MSRNYYSIFIRDIDLSFSFSVFSFSGMRVSLTGFGIKVTLALEKEFGSAPPASFSLSNLRNTSCRYSLKAW